MTLTVFLLFLSSWFVLFLENGGGSMCVCADTSTKLIISNKRSVKFLALKALWSLRSHTDNFFCFVCCFVFPAFIFKISHVTSR